MPLTHEPMTPIITAFSYTPINIDVTSVQDAYPKEDQVGYKMTFDLMTARFRITGECELLEYPLTREQLQSKLIEGLKEDFKEASQNIQPILKWTPLS